MELYFEPGREADLDELGRLYDRLNEHLEQTVNYPGWRKGIYPVRETAAGTARIPLTEKPPGW